MSGLKIDRRQFLGLLGLLGAPRVLLSQGSAITVLRSPYLQRMRGDRVSLLWATLEAGEGRVQCSSSSLTTTSAVAQSRPFYPQETGLPYSYVQYEVELSGLEAKSLYDYSVSVNGQIIQQAQFNTAGPGPFDFLVFGDSGTQMPAQAAVASRMALERPSFVLHVGDIAYNDGTFAQYQSNFFDFYRGIMSHIPFFPTPGNHDYLTDEAAAYMSIYRVPTQSVPIADQGRYYSFDWGNAHFVSLNSNTPLEQAVEQNGPMLRWLERDLNATRQFWRIVFFHHPAYAGGPHQTDLTCAVVRERIVPVLERYGVQLVFSGHEHSYQRSHPLSGNGVTTPGQGIVYVTTGGGGADLYAVFEHPLISTATSQHHYLRTEVRDTTLSLTAINDAGKIIDTYTLAPAPAIEAFKQIPAVSFNPSRVAGAIVRIMGRHLAAEERYIYGAALPLDLAGTVVTINDRPLQLIYTSSSQIYARIPFDPEPLHTLRVITKNGFSETAV